MRNPFRYGGGVVNGLAFCNRTKELQDLLRVAEKSEKPFIYSERRKTSLFCTLLAAWPEMRMRLPMSISGRRLGEASFVTATAKSIAESMSSMAEQLLKTAKKFLGYLTYTKGPSSSFLKSAFQSRSSYSPSSSTWTRNVWSWKSSPSFCHRTLCPTLPKYSATVLLYFVSSFPFSCLVSPQRLVYYRANWYLDAWCHLRRALRSFAVDAIRKATILSVNVREVGAAALDMHLGAGYGIYAGPARNIAVLRFTPEAARWVAREQWHARQVQRYDADGFLVLDVPYSRDEELLMDILRYGGRVEAMKPPSLREKVEAALGEALRKYRPAVQAPKSGSAA